MAAAASLPIVSTFDEFLQAEQAKDLLRFTTAGKCG